jgi:thiol-disulfide isomerase/thioredoxin
MRILNNTLRLLPFLLCSAPAPAQKSIPFIKTDQLTYWKNAETDTVRVLNFWATWCGPCVKELPAFDSLQAKYADQKVQVLLISTDFRKNVESKLRQFIQQKGIQSQVVFLDERNPNDFINLVDPSWSGALPATLILSGRNKSFRFHEGELEYAELEKMLLEIR